MFISVKLNTKIHSVSQRAVLGALSSCSSTEAGQAAEPVVLPYTASSGANGSVTLLLGSHLDKLGLGSDEGTVSLSGVAVDGFGAAVPVLHGAAATRANGSLTLRIGHLQPKSIGQGHEGREG